MGGYENDKDMWNWRKVEDDNYQYPRSKCGKCGKEDFNFNMDFSSVDHRGLNSCKICSGSAVIN